jgi:hypothetical protein
MSPAGREAERHVRDISPTVKKEHKRLPSISSSTQPGSQGETQQPPREQYSMHRQLPSLSDVLDGQPLPSSVRPTSEPGGFRFPGPPGGSAGRPLGPIGGDGRPPLTTTNDRPYNGIASGPPPPANHSRAPVDGPLPVHALLASKPDSSFPTANASSHSHQPNAHSYPVDQQQAMGPMHHPMHDGPAGHATMNGWSPVGQPV